MGAGFDLSVESFDLVLEIVGIRVDGHTDAESGWVADRPSGAIESLREPREGANELEDIDVVDIVDSWVVTELRGVSGDDQEVSDARVPGPQELRLESHQAGVAGGHVGYGLDAGLALDLGRDPEAVHPQAREGIRVDVDRVDASMVAQPLRDVDEPLRVGALRGVELNDLDEAVLREAFGESRIGPPWA
jgi:hypothetical protein